MPVELVTVPDVEILTTGTYALSTGEATFTAEDLAAAVEAVNDPAVRTPRLKLGHEDVRDGFDGTLDGEPALGRVENLRVSDDGQTLIGDYVGVPAWLGEMLPTAYPSRSIEGQIGVTTASGHSHRLVISAVALLGTALPGVATLEDLELLLSENGPAPAEPATIAAASSRRPLRIAASVDVEDVSRAFYGHEATGMWDWVRSIRLDPNELIVEAEDSGDVFRIPFTVDGDTIVLGDRQQVKVEYRDVAAAEQRTAATWTTRAASRPKGGTMSTTIDLDALRARLKLPADADEEAINAALKASENADDDDEEREGDEEKPAVDPSPQIPGPGSPDQPGEDDVESDKEDEEEKPEGEPARQKASGAVAIDAAALEQLRRDAASGRKAHERQEREDRTRLFASAIGEGRFPPSRRKHYERLWAADPEGTRRLLTASVSEGGLAPGSVPVDGSQHGSDGTGEDVAAGSWITPHERTKPGQIIQGA
jgi:hypothetical protein